MFLSMLKPNEKKAFLKLAKAFIYADEILDTNEAELFNEMLDEMAITSESINIEEEIDIKNVVSLFESKKSKSIVLLELVRIGLADNNFSFDESTFLRKISEAMELNTSDMYLIKNWVDKKIRLDQELKKILGED